MCFEVKLRMGYFKTIQCNMVMSDNKIILSPVSDHNGEIMIGDIDTLVISGIENKNPHIEIQARDNTYLCMINGAYSPDELLSTMRKELNNSRTIICNP